MRRITLRSSALRCWIIKLTGNHFETIMKLTVTDSKVVVMPAITIKNIPDDLYNQLKLAAEQHRRSINSELIACVEKALSPNKISAQEHIAGARRIRQRLGNFSVTPDDLDVARNTGRR